MIKNKVLNAETNTSVTVYTDKEIKKGVVIACVSITTEPENKVSNISFFNCRPFGYKQSCCVNVQNLDREGVLRLRMSDLSLRLRVSELELRDRQILLRAFSTEYHVSGYRTEVRERYSMMFQ